MPARLPRWSWLLVLPMLVGALLLMHGLDANAGDHHDSVAAAAAPGVEAYVHTEAGAHVDAAASSERGHCLDCLARHAMAACMAIIISTTIVGLGFTRRGLGGGLFSTLAAAPDRARSRVKSARRPDPAWVRLSVMRC